MCLEQVMEVLRWKGRRLKAMDQLGPPPLPPPPPPSSLSEARVHPVRPAIVDLNTLN